jgi:hypothetical protein
MTPKGQIIKGYKATDKNMRCRDHQFEIGTWYECEGELSLCNNGFHFCEYPSGPWSYYSNGRLFECEAEEVLLSSGPGSDIKHVAKRIRLIKEITVDGAGNTGDRNTGDRNTGNWNTGDGNTGHRNTGDRNTGDGNTGHRNTGDSNTGHGNTGNYHSGCLNHGEAQFHIFNKPAKRNDVDFNLVSRLSRLLVEDNEIDPTPFLSLPNSSVEAIKALHDAHKTSRSNLK